jgi:thiol:disulfide interchange protein
MYAAALWLLWVLLSLILVVTALSVLRMPLLEPRNGPGIGMSGEEYLAEFEPFAAARVDELRASGIPVFVNMTAAWCITCLANEQTTLNTQRVQQAMRDHGITYMKGDWTNQDPEISRVLDAFNRPSVPLYILYPGNTTGEPRLLPQLLTPAIVMDAFASL